MTHIAPHGNDHDGSEPAPLRRRSVLRAATGIAFALGTVSIPGPAVAATSLPQCGPRETGGPWWITEDCVDPQYDRPVIDDESDQAEPVSHRKVSGHFDGTGVKFTFYLPPKKQWQGRFFQNVYPVQDENASADTVAFGADSGAYTVHVTGTAGYRAVAAAAKYSRTVAARYYQQPDRRIYGYVYGGSGGSFQTIGGIENTTGVWDGAVPYIVGTPVAIPHNFFIRELARIVLRGKAPQIADAMRPGGSGDPYTGLDEVERAVLREVTRMGVPLRMWEDYPYLLGIPNGLLGFGSTVRAMDPTYADDFWTKPGYLGTEQSPLGELIRAARIDQLVTITEVERNAQGTPTRLVLDSAPTNPRTTELAFTLYSADGTAVQGTLSGSLDPAARTFTPGSGNSADVLKAIDAGDRLRIDNRWGLALPVYPRYQVPTRPGFHAFDQYRDADGKPLHPQRAIEIGPRISLGVSGGGTFTGKITGKVIAVVNLHDVDAFPWDGDWYREQVRHSLGNRYDDRFRVWFTDHADHIAPPRTARLIDYTGILQQALRDVSAWVEEGRAPARSTRYELTPDSQIEVPAEATERRGIQPVVDLTVEGGDRVEVQAGQAVTFEARIEVPPGAGRVVSTEWDFTGTGDFDERPSGPPRQTVKVKATHTYAEPGTYFPSLRATSHREGDARTPFARVRNLGRVRVVVR